MEEQKRKIDADVAMRYLAHKVLEIPEEETAPGDNNYGILALRVYKKYIDEQTARRRWRFNAWFAVCVYVIVNIVKMI